MSKPKCSLASAWMMAFAGLLVSGSELCLAQTYFCWRFNYNSSSNGCENCYGSTNCATCSYTSCASGFQVCHIQFDYQLVLGPGATRVSETIPCYTFYGCKPVNPPCDVLGEPCTMDPNNVLWDSSTTFTWYYEGPTPCGS